jgi:hypothetical protein
MRFTDVAHDDETANMGRKTVSPGRVGAGAAGDRSILQVPSLASTDRPNAFQTITPNKRARYEEQVTAGGIPTNTIRRASPCPPGWPMRPMGFAAEENVYADPAMGWGQYYPDSQHHGMRLMGQYPPTVYDPRFHFRHQGAESIMRQPAQYNPPRVRSGRGSLRVVAVNRGQTGSPQTTSVARSTFPVSNRGKGSRRPSACRAPVPAVDLSQTSAATTDRSSSLVGTGHQGNSVQCVAVAISRKTKRKLPLARKITEPSTETETVSNA